MYAYSRQNSLTSNTDSLSVPTRIEEPENEDIAVTSYWLNEHARIHLEGRVVPLDHTLDCGSALASMLGGIAKTKGDDAAVT